MFVSNFKKITEPDSPADRNGRDFFQELHPLRLLGHLDIHTVILGFPQKTIERFDDPFNSPTLVFFGHKSFLILY